MNILEVVIFGIIARFSIQGFCVFATCEFGSDGAGGREEMDEDVGQLGVVDCGILLGAVHNLHTAFCVWRL